MVTLKTAKALGDIRIAHMSQARQGAKKETRKVVDLHDRRKILELNASSEADTADAAALINQALLRVSLLFSSMYQTAAQKIHWFLPTDAIDTMAVASSGDGAVMFLYNVPFVKSLSNPVEDVLFVSLHELTHLFLGDLCYSPDLQNDQTFVLAQEVCNNHFCLTRLGRKAMPTTESTDPLTGKVTHEPSGVDPRKVYREYAKAVEDAVSYETFVSTPMRCFSEMKRMPNPPGQGAKYQLCVHQSAPGDDKGDGKGLPADGDTISAVVKGALEQAMQDALKGDSKAREELLALAEITEGSSEKADKMWGDLGLGALRGESVKVRKVEWWSRWLRRVLGSKLTHGGKLVYPRKRAGILNLLGHDSPMLHRGPEKTKRVIRAIDTSGSMSQEFLNRFFKVTGKTTGVEWIDLSFDAVVMPYEAGERVYGGGGTSFDVVRAYVEGELEVNGKKFDGRYDAVIMVTDGYAPHISPKDPSKWIWLVTEDGDMWMEGTRMLCQRIDLPD